MSGGHFDYWPYHIGTIADKIEEEIEQNKDRPDWWDNWEGQRFSDETIAEFRKGVELLRKAEIYANRIDWLLSGDDDERSFHERLKEELAKLEAMRNGNITNSNK